MDNPVFLRFQRYLRETKSSEATHTLARGKISVPDTDIILSAFRFAVAKHVAEGFADADT